MVADQEHERCLQCVRWDSIRWPWQQWRIIRFTGYSMLGGIFVWQAWSNLNRVQEDFGLWYGAMLSIVIGALFTITCCYVAAREAWQRIRQRLHGNYRDRVLFFSVHVEDRLHIHRHETRDSDSKYWLSQPCLLGYGRAGEAGRCVARNASSALLEINLVHSKKSCLHGRPGDRWHVKVSERHVEFISTQTSESVTKLLPTKQDPGQSYSAYDSYMSLSQKSLCDGLRLINQYRFADEIDAAALAEKPDTAVAGNINTAS